jgi:hypothetical protein
VERRKWKAERRKWKVERRKWKGESGKEKVESGKWKAFTKYDAEGLPTQPRTSVRGLGFRLVIILKRYYPRSLGLQSGD